MKLRILLPAALAALAGCTVGPNFKPPAAPSASAYTGASDPLKGVPGAPVAIAGEGPRLRWWEAFGSPTLNALVDRAIANNYSLAASNATLERAREQIAEAAGHRLPQIDANARVEHEEVNLAAFGFNPAALGGKGNPEFNLYTVGGGISYDLDLFGGKRRAVEQAAAQAEAQLRQTEAAHLTLAGRVVNQVLTIAAIRTRIAAANALLAEDQRNIDLTQKRRQAGEGTLVEVLNAQSQLAADRSDLPQLGQELEEARHMLATLIGVMPANLGPTDFELAQFTLPASVPVTLPSELVHKRPDILQAEADLHAATAAIGVATARLYPDINLGATLSQAAPNLGNVLGAGFRGFDIFAGLTAPIFHGGTLKAQKREAVDQARAAAATYQQTLLDAFRQVADLLDAIKSDSGSVASQQQAVDVAARSLHLSRRSFQVGNSGLLQVLESERLYQRARLALVDDQQRQYLNVARLYVATAGGWTGPAQVADSSAK
jgi:NodT family efflux transporter outer membrane factor (OMF) lipoprotein